VPTSSIGQVGSVRDIVLPDRVHDGPVGVEGELIELVTVL
jgi:hypothetical protein